MLLDYAYSEVGVGVPLWLHQGRSNADRQRRCDVTLKIVALFVDNAPSDASPGLADIGLGEGQAERRRVFACIRRLELRPIDFDRAYISFATSESRR